MIGLRKVGVKREQLQIESIHSRIKPMKKDSGSPIKYTLIYLLLLMVFTAITAFFIYPKAIENIERVDLKGHYELYKKTKTHSDILSISVPLYSGSNIIYSSRELPSLGRDKTHLTLEALLLEQSEEEKSKGLESAIAKKTKLIGASEDNGYFFIELSKEFLKSEDIEKALKEIHAALQYYMNVKELTILSDGKTFKSLKD